MQAVDSDLSVWTDILENQIRESGEIQPADIDNALSHINENNDRGLFGLCYFYKAYYSLKNGKQDESLKYLNESIRFMLGTGQEGQLARCYNLLGIIAHGQNNLLLAAEQYDKALAYAGKYKNRYMHYIVVNNLADVYYRIGSYERALECYRESICESEQYGDNSAIGAYNYMAMLSGYGYCLVMAGKTEEARQVSERLYAMKTETNSELFPELSAFTFFALLCYKLNRLDIAENCLNVAVRSVVNLKSVTEEFDSLLNLAELLIMRKKYDFLGELLDHVGPLAATENDGLWLQLLAYRLKYCGDDMPDEQYIEKAEHFIRIKAEFESREYGQVVNMMEMRKSLHSIEERQIELEEQGMKLKYQADHDELSGLYNKRCLNQYAEEAFEQAMRKQKMLGILFVDIDYFKQMNDSYGHGKGDECIKAVADSIRECMPGEFAARYGGDEFVIIIPGKDEDYVKNCAEKVVENVRNRKIENKDSQVSDILTVTVGAVCAVPKKHNKIWDFLAAADEALYVQKNEKKGGMCFRGKVGGE